jgi:desulfoferrodoxin (superoxide reductase-like protein)
LQPCGVPNSRRNVVGVMMLIPGLDANEQAVAQRFHQKWGIVFEKIQETPGKKSPDVTFEIQGFKIVAEIKTIEDALRVQISSGEIELTKSADHFLGYAKLSDGDNTLARVARTVEKACEQLVESDIQLKAVILSNKDCALVDDLDDFLSNHRSTGTFREPLPPGARIARQNLKCSPNLFFWVDIKKEELHVRIGELPSSIETFFREKLNG